MTASPETDKSISLTTRMRLLQLEVGQIERNNDNLQGMLDRALAMYNDLMEWVVNTQHDIAASEVQTILEVHMKVDPSIPRKISPMSTNESSRTTGQPA